MNDYRIALTQQAKDDIIDIGNEIMRLGLSIYSLDAEDTAIPELIKNMDTGYGRNRCA